MYEPLLVFAAKASLLALCLEFEFPVAKLDETAAVTAPLTALERLRVENVTFAT